MVLFSSPPLNSMLWGDVQCSSMALAAVGSGLSAAGCALDKLCLFITEHGQLRDFCVSVLFRSIIFVSFVCVCACVCAMLSHVRLFATPGTVAHQAPLSMGFPRQEYWSGLPFPSRESSWPKDWTWVSCIAGRFFTVWVPLLYFLWIGLFWPRLLHGDFGCGSWHLL